MTTLQQLFAHYAVQGALAIILCIVVLVIIAGILQTIAPQTFTRFPHRKFVIAIAAVTIIASLIHMTYRAIIFAAPSAGVKVLRATPSQDRVVALIHGWTGDAATWSQFIAMIEQEPISADVVGLHYPMEPPNGDETIAHSASALAEFLSSNPQYSDVRIVAHSLGGVVARYFVVAYPDLSRRVSAIVTLGSPHAGTDLARGGSKFFELSPSLLEKVKLNSPYLIALDRRWQEQARQNTLPTLHCVASRADLFVPLDSALRACSADNRLTLPNVAHDELARPVTREGDHFDFIRQRALQ